MGSPKAHPAAAAPVFVDWQRTIGMRCHGLAMVLAGMFKRANGLLKRGRCPRHARKLCGTTLGMLTLAHCLPTQLVGGGDVMGSWDIP